MQETIERDSYTGDLLELLPRPRRGPSGLPEDTAFKDDGCSYHSACLTCPFERCRYDEPRGLRGGTMVIRILAQQRQEADR